MFGRTVTALAFSLVMSTHLPSFAAPMDVPGYPADKAIGCTTMPETRVSYPANAEDPSRGTITIVYCGEPKFSAQQSLDQPSVGNPLAKKPAQHVELNSQSASQQLTNKPLEGKQITCKIGQEVTISQPGPNGSWLVAVYCNSQDIGAFVDHTADQNELR